MTRPPSNPEHPSPIRGAGLTWQLEDYLEAIARILERDRVARASEIADQLKVTRASVTSALHNLAGKGLINYQPYSQITLTPAGQKLAAQIINRHKTLSLFLQEVLGVPRPQAEANACRAEHVIGQEVIERMGSFLEFLKTCPRTSPAWREAFLGLCQGQPRDDECRECVGRCLAGLYGGER